MNRARTDRGDSQLHSTNWLTHLYFTSVNPFEDGNGRIERAIAENALAQCLDQHTLIAIACTIEQYKTL